VGARACACIYVRALARMLAVYIHQYLLARNLVPYACFQLQELTVFFFTKQSQIMLLNQNSLQCLNDNPTLDFIKCFSNNPSNDFEESPYVNLNLDGKFYDIDTMSLDLCNENSSFCLSLNVQSIMSKYDSLNVFVLELLAKGINVELIALQEIWNVEFPDLLDIEGFQPLIYKQRTNMRGGGVGFYVKNNINFEIVENCSHFESKVFESLTLLLSKQNNEKMYVTSLYRSNGPLPNFTANEKRKKFDDAFDSLLSNLSEKSHQSFIFADSNINLLSNNNDVYMDYLNAMFANGFLQICNKATRMQGPSSSLIDHIITNCTYHSFVSGSIVSDISDHFPTFICLQKNRSRKSAKEITSRLFTIDKINAFKFLLSNANWQYVLDKLDVNTAYESFWDIYKNNFESTFPLTKVKFNRNIHKKTGFITAGLLISRGTKLSLHKQSLINPTFATINQYKQFRNIYTKTLRAAKKLHILNLLKENKGNAKKTWEILNECIGRNSKIQKFLKLI